MIGRMPSELTRREFLRLAAAAGSTLALPTLLTDCDSAHGGGGGQWFRSARPGADPTSRRPQVASVTLPAGRPWVPEETYGALPPRPVAWVTDHGWNDAFSLARELVAAFPKTGLWPCLWLDPDRPASYCSPLPRPNAIDAARTEAILRGQWQRLPPQAAWVAPLGTGWPGLAAATTA